MLFVSGCATHAGTILSSATGRHGILPAKTRCGGVPLCALWRVSKISTNSLIAAGNLGHRCFPCHLLRAPVDKRLPEARPSDGEANEARHSSRGCQPFANLLIVLTPTQNDTTDLCAAVPARSSHNPFAVLVPVESFDLPYVRLDACVLKLLDGLRHQQGAKFQVVGLLVSFQLIELGSSQLEPAIRT